MKMRQKNYSIALLLSLALVGCEQSSTHKVSDGQGKTPDIPQTNKTFIPTINIAPAIGWPKDTIPQPATGLKVVAMAENLEHPRWLYVLPNSDVLVAETNAPEGRPDDSPGIRGWVQHLIMKRAGATVPSADRITLLRDIDANGVAKTKTVFLKGLHSPFGIALIGDKLYVANTDALVSFPYKAGETQITEAPTKVTELPGGTINHHWTKNVVASKDGSKLYVSVGSNSNVAENGIEQEKERAAIWEVDAATGAHRVFASGLRNPVGMAWEPTTGLLWTAVNERDELGSDLVPDYMTSVKDDGFYGWPYSYYGTHVDDRVTPQRPDLVAKAIIPDFALGSHTASLGLTFADGARLTSDFSNGAFIGQHGSWNRKPLSGYKVVFVPFKDGQPNGLPVDVLTGFLSPDEKAYGRPVGVAIDKQGALLVADDVGNKIWRVTVSAQRNADLSTKTSQ